MRPVKDVMGNLIDSTNNSDTFMGDACPNFDLLEENGTLMVRVTYSEDMLNDASPLSANYITNYIFMKVYQI